MFELKNTNSKLIAQTIRVSGGRAAAFDIKVVRTDHESGAKTVRLTKAQIMNLIGYLLDSIEAPPSVVGDRGGSFFSINTKELGSDRHTRLFLSSDGRGNCCIGTRYLQDNSLSLIQEIGKDEAFDLGQVLLREAMKD